MGIEAVVATSADMWLAALAAIIFIIFISSIALWIIVLRNVGKVKRRLDIVSKGGDNKGLEGMFGRLNGQAEEFAARLGAAERSVAALEKKTGSLKAHVGLLRYNPFEERGHDLSFSIAIVDDRNDGVVISSLHSRNESLVYAKPIVAGNSTYTLTPEEKEAITQATRKS